MAEDTFPKSAVLSMWCCWIFLILPRMIVPPLLPLVEKEFTLSYEGAALLMSLYMLSYAVTQLPAGLLSDRFGNKYFIIISIFGACLPAVLMAFTSTFGSLLLLRIFSGLAAGLFYAPSTAYILQSTSIKNRGMALGLVFTGGSVASILISLLINFLPVQEYGWRSFFSLCAIPGLLFTPILLFTLKGRRREATSHKGLDFKGFLRGLKSPQLVTLMLYNFVSSLSSWSLTTFIPTFFVVERGFTVSTTALLMLTYSFTSVLSGPLSGIAAQRLGLKIPGFLATVAMCIVSFATPLSYSPTTIIIVLAIWGLIGGLSWSPYNVLLTELVPQNLRGTFLGIFNLIGFLSGTIGPVIFGRVADTAGFGAFFTLSLLLSAISTIFSIAIIKLRS